MPDVRFDPALEDLLRDPLTARMMASDRVAMPTLVALLTETRSRLAARRRSEMPAPQTQRAGSPPAPAKRD